MFSSFRTLGLFTTGYFMAEFGNNKMDIHLHNPYKYLTKREPAILTTVNALPYPPPHHPESTTSCITDPRGRGKHD